MSCLTPTVMREPIIDVLQAEQLMTTSCRILELDLTKMKTTDVEFSSFYELECTYKDKA